jgi:1-acyl-sn-glycerol-3-phosphate acyltransferase
MSAASNLPLKLWLAFWRAGQRYHRYTVVGLEHLNLGRSALIVGYHGRPFAFDMCMLTVAIHDRLGYLPHGIVNRSVRHIPPLRWLTDGLAFVTGDDQSLGAAVRRGEHIVVTPGGPREAARSFRSNYRVDWGDHLGYLRLALKHKLPIVPVAAAGADGTYIGLTDAYAIGERLGLPHDWAWLPWIGLGPLGIFPFSPPFPVRMHQIVGEPIDPLARGAIDPGNHAALRRLHERVTQRVQTLLDQALAERRGDAS